MGLYDGIRWRYQNYIEPHLVVYRHPIAALQRRVRNRGARNAADPIAYIYANPSNAGDYASYLGIRQLVGRDGAEIFCDRVALGETLSTLAAGPRDGSAWRGVFIGGGGLLQREFDDFWRGLLGCDVPFVLFGVGANELLPHRKLTDKTLLEGIARRAVALHVRDQFTKDVLDRHGATNVTVGICPSVNYVSEAARSFARTETHLLHAVHESDLKFGGVDPPALRARIERLAAQLGLQYDETDHMSSVNAKLLKRYARAAVIVSSRLHGAIFSYAMRKPLVAIESDLKMGAFLDTHESNAVRVSAPQTENITADLLKQVMSRPLTYDYDASLAANRARMSEIASKLGLSTAGAR